MGRIADIIERVRDSLGDDAGDRWADARILRVIDESQKKINRKAKALRSKTELAIVINQNEYDLPDNAYCLTRVRDKGREKIPFHTHEQMDLLSSTWETEEGEQVYNVVFDKIDPKRIKIHPIPTADDVSESFLINPYGIIVDSDTDIMANDLGVIAEVSTDALNTATWNQIYGVITDMSAITTSILIYYIRIPETINAIDIGTSVLEVHDVFDAAIQHYTVARLLMDDKETRNEAASAKEMILYGEELKLAMSDASTNYTKHAEHRSAYRGFQ